MKIYLRKLLGIVTAAAIACPILTNTAVMQEITVSAEEETGNITVSEPLPEINRDEELPDFEEPAVLPMYSFPENMRGAYVTPGIDYAVSEDGEALTEDEIALSVENMLDTAEEYKLNSIIIRTDYKGESFYSTDINETVERTPTEYAVSAAKERGFYVYLNFSLDNAIAAIEDMDMQSRIDRLAIIVHSFTVKYPVDGIILDGYYSSKNNASLNDYIKNGSGIGFENWLLDNDAYVFSLAADAVRRTNNTVPVGIALNDVWANYSTNKDGTETSVDFEALTDGYADTLSYIKNGYADFIMLKAEGSLSDSDMPFNEIVGWWDAHAEEADIPLYVHHMNERICTDAEGWSSPDELVKQVIAAGSYESYGGSAFDSLSSLDENVMESTGALMKHYDDEIDLEGLNSELEMTLPTKTTFKTEEPTVIFAGSFDPNFPVYYQGKEIELNEAGRFYFTEDLDVGVNTFKFQSKAKVITYKITRTVNVLKSVSPADDVMRVEEQSTIALSAIAYKGSSVSANVNGKNVILKETDSQLDELDPNSNYTKYTGYYTAPKGTRGQDIDLGRIEFYGTYPTDTGNINGSRTGAHIIVNALAEVQNDFSGNMIRVNSDNTMVYGYNSTTTDPSPDCARLPAGTLDYIVRTVTYSGVDYYLTNSGKRIRKDAVTVLENEPMGSNPISVAAAGKDGTDTVIKFKMPVKTPFSISYGSTSYTEGGNGGYYVSSFDTGYITITFDYITSISSGDITFPDSAVFTDGTWSASEYGDVKQAKLTLSLRQNGIFGGMTSSYDSEDNLVLRFNGCRSGISGATIVIDPGHGYTGRSAFDPGAIGHVKEQEANLAIAKYVEQMLSDEGANVIRYKTESEVYPTENRSSDARQYSPDMFVSIHCNSAAGESGTGAEAYYFTPFSQPLADCISAELGSYIKSEIHSDGYGDRGEKYNYFWVTLQQDFPSVLVETAFVTNYSEAMALAEPSSQKKFAKAIVTGIKKYFERTNYSCFGDGDASWADIGGVIPAEPEEETYPPADTFDPSDAETPDPQQEENYTSDDPSNVSPDTGTPDAAQDIPEDYDPNDPYYQYFYSLKQ